MCARVDVEERGEDRGLFVRARMREWAFEHEGGCRHVTHTHGTHTQEVITMAWENDPRRKPEEIKVSMHAAQMLFFLQFCTASLSASLSLSHFLLTYA